MIVPSIDLLGGRAVQLVGGEDLAIDAGAPRPILDRFAVAGEVAVIDLDAARGEGNNREVARSLCENTDVRVGGGIRDYKTARDWLDAGAHRIILGTAATPELLKKLPSDRVIVALDEKGGEIVTHGWRSGSGHRLLERTRSLRDLCSGFLVTFVEREGRLGGTDLDRARAVVAAAGDTRVTIAGGITTTAEIAELDRIGADAQVGMALYRGDLDLGEAIAAPLVSDREDGLWPTVVTDEFGTALGLAWSSLRSLRRAVTDRRGVYESRSRGLWQKGGTSGATQELLRVDLDCDRDALRFSVRQYGNGFCHHDTRTCWGEDRGLARLERRLATRRQCAPAGSNTARLLSNPELLASKLREEAAELAANDANVVHEAADLLFFTLARLVAAEVPLATVTHELDRRERQISRRPCEPKDPQ